MCVLICSTLKHNLKEFAKKKIWFSLPLFVLFLGQRLKKSVYVYIQKNKIQFLSSVLKIVYSSCFC